jgi:drug/metabolite transporter (DMT)-like permease
MATELWEMGLIVISSVLVGLAPIYIKKGINKIKKMKIDYFITNWNLIFGLFLYGCSYIISIPAFKGGDLSVLYPLVSLSYIWVSIFSVKFLKEKMNTIKWIGIILIMIGVSFIGLGA